MERLLRRHNLCTSLHPPGSRQSNSPYAAPVAMSDERASRWRRFVGPAIILLAALLAVVPQLVRGNSCGHDFDFHLVSWLATAQMRRAAIVFAYLGLTCYFRAREPHF